jgi:hypothetical protein
MINNRTKEAIQREYKLQENYYNSFWIHTLAMGVPRG